jgi:SAM-dependent methyltransferase
MTEPLAARQRREVEHHAHAERDVEIREVSESTVPWNLRAFEGVLKSYFPGEAAFRGMRVLDCGCGPGILSILMAKRGALLDAFDISEHYVGIARRYCEANGVKDQVDVRAGVMEQMDYPAGRFDLVLGTRILHHVDISSAAAEVHRVLKPGGMALFWEPTLTNPVYNAMRRLYRMVPALPRAGSPDEHPLTEQELRALSRTFDGKFRMHGTPFYLFSHMARAVGLTRIIGVAPSLSLLDRGIDMALPALRRSNVHQILAMRKAAEL